MPLKMNRLRLWCEDINRLHSGVAYDFVYVDQKGFEKYEPKSFRDLLASFRESKKNE